MAKFPEKLHHVRETEVLFARLRLSAPASLAKLDRLHREQARGEAAICNLQYASLACQLIGGSRRAEFVDALERYTMFYVEHLRTEMAKALKSDELVKAWNGLGAEMPDLYGEAFGKFVSSETKRWAEVVKSSGAKLE